MGRRLMSLEEFLSTILPIFSAMSQFVAFLVVVVVYVSENVHKMQYAPPFGMMLENYPLHEIAASILSIHLLFYWSCVLWKAWSLRIVLSGWVNIPLLLAGIAVPWGLLICTIWRFQQGFVMHEVGAWIWIVFSVAYYFGVVAVEWFLSHKKRRLVHPVVLLVKAISAGAAFLSIAGFLICDVLFYADVCHDKKSVECLRYYSVNAGIEYFVMFIATPLAQLVWTFDSCSTIRVVDNEPLQRPDEYYDDDLDDDIPSRPRYWDDEGDESS